MSEGIRLPELCTKRQLQQALCISEATVKRQFSAVDRDDAGRHLYRTLAAIDKYKTLAKREPSPHNLRAAFDPLPPPADNSIIQGDCLDVLASMERGRARLLFADPPFNIGLKYDSHTDRMPIEKYLEFSRDWIDLAYDVLSNDGTFLLALRGNAGLHHRVFSLAMDAGFHWRNDVIWHYTFAEHQKENFAKAHTPIGYFVKNPARFTFNADAIRVTSARQLCGDKRADPLGKVPSNVWTISRVCGTFKERCGWHPCQMPRELMERIIKAHSYPGDLVVDPFSGSGSTAVAAARLGRRYIGIDKSANYVERSRERIATVAA